MLKKILEIILGLAIFFSLIANYSDGYTDSKLIIWYLLKPKVLQVIAWIALFFVAGRLMFGKYKDYSKYFSNLFTKCFGDSGKVNGQS